MGPVALGSSLGRPRRPQWVFAGIRKLVECDSPNMAAPGPAEPGFRLEPGTAVTYSNLQVDSEEALTKLVGGKAPVCAPQ
jgi:hypothetical protein